MTKSSRSTAIAAAAILLLALGAAWWGARDPLVPETSPVWSFDRFVSPREVVIEQDERGDYHLYVSGREDYEGHVQRPLPWDRVAARRDFSVPLKASRDEPGGAFRIWFGSVTRRSMQGELKTSWFAGNGKEVERKEVAEIAETHGVDLERWSLQAKPDSLRLQLVGGFEGVRKGFVARGGQIFVPGAGEPIVPADPFLGEAEKPRHFLTVNVPGASFENFLMTVDLAWGDRRVRLDPRVGARGDFGDFFTEVVFLEPFSEGAARSQKGPFATSFNRQERLRVESTTMALFASDPAWLYFIYSEFVSKAGQSEVRYFSTHKTDLRAVSMPIALENLDHVVLHWRHRRCRAVFPLGRLPVPQ